MSEQESDTIRECSGKIILAAARPSQCEDHIKLDLPSLLFIRPDSTEPPGNS